MECAATPFATRIKDSPMCLALPMRIKAMNGLTATCEAKGIEREVSLFMLAHESLQPGDHVLVHVGYAIQKVTSAEASATWELLDEIAAHA
jgi:hydrogenase expression/formation protein HypC